MAPDSSPDDFNWVAAQSTCNAASMFDRLVAGVKEDVQRRNGLLGRDDGWTFEVHEDGDDEFEVSRVVKLGGDSTVAALVRFERAGRRIHVHGDDVDVDFTAVVALDAAGACRFVVADDLYPEWEIRRMALEQLFFEEAEAQD
jgi:hypothetical protein